MSDEERPSAVQAADYRVDVLDRPSFHIVGYTTIVQPGDADAFGAFWNAMTQSGALERLVECASGDSTLLALGSWDPDCPRGGQRYTIGIEERAGVDFGPISGDENFFRKRIGASSWLTFHLLWGQFGEFWKDEAPYLRMEQMGYQFNMTDYDVGLHFEAYPPGFSWKPTDEMEMWFTVVRAQSEG